MGLGEILGLGANVVLNLRADTSQAKAALKDLSGEERKAAEAALKLTEAENKRLETKAKRWQFIGQSIGAVSAVMGVAKSGLEAYAKKGDEAAASVKRIQESAGKAFDGVMASIGKVVVSLEPLLNKFTWLVDKLNEVGVAGPAAIGALALAVTGNPVIAGIIGGGAWAVSGDFGGGDFIDENGNINFAHAAGRIYKKKREQFYAGRRGIRDQAGDVWNKLPGLISDGIVFGLGKAGIDKWSPFEVKKSKAEHNILDPDDLGTYGSRYRIGAGSGSTGIGAFDTGAGQRGIDMIMARQRAAFDAGSRGLMSPYAAQGAGIQSAQQSQLAQVFGPLTEFNAYAAAFDTLGGAVGSALGAWIDGSMSAGKAFKAFIAEAVKGIAIQMAMEALKHGAFAIGSLAFGDFKSAALHGQAAGQFALGAAAASIAAKGLNGSSGGAPSSAGGYRPVAPSTAAPASGANPSSAVIVVGDPFAYDSPRNQQKIAKRLTSMAVGTSAVVYG